MLQAPDADFGQVWHLPSAPTTTARQLVEIGAASLGVSPKVFSFPLGTLRLLGLVMPLAKELGEMQFQWDRPFRVNAEKFSQRFSFKPTPFSESVAITAKSFAP